MTSIQKIIKYGAIAFGIYLAINIISAIIFGFTALVGITTGINHITTKKDSGKLIQYTEEYENTSNLKIDLEISKLNIKIGDKLRVEASTIDKEFYSNLEGNTLVIKENVKNTFIDTDSEVTLYIPEEIDFDKVDIKTGINEINIEYLKAEEIDLKAGIGKTSINNLVADVAKIECGAGETNINNSEVGKLKLKSGVGKTVINIDVLKEGKIEAGVGKLELLLRGNQEDYSIRTESGIGSVNIDGKSAKDNFETGNGNKKIELEAGIGNVDIRFGEKII